MTPLFGRRTAVEGAFLVVVPFAAYEAGASWPWIIAAGAVAYLLVLAWELVLWRRSGRAVPVPAAAGVPAEAADVLTLAAAEHVRVLRSEPEPVTEPVRQPEPVAVEPEPVAVEAEPPQLVSVPEPEPEPEPEPAAEVIPIGLGSAPRQWNVWDLEQLAREHAGGDPIADEERTFLLMYLRDFAGADGLLPVDFDDLVRQSFGSLVTGR